MALLFGEIADASIIGDTVRVTGSNWVACAFDRDDPILVTSLHHVRRRKSVVEDVQALASASDVYDAEIEAEGSAERVTVVINGTRKIQFLCDRIEIEHRYYTEAEARDLISSLKAHVPESELRKYLHHLEERGVSLSLPI